MVSVTAFLIDIGLPADAPQHFAKYLEDHLFPGQVRQHLSIGVAADPEAECERYGDLLKAVAIACGHRRKRSFGLTIAVAILTSEAGQGC